MCPANERWRYSVTPSLIGWVHTQNDPCISNKFCMFLWSNQMACNRAIAYVIFVDHIYS